MSLHYLNIYTSQWLLHISVYLMPNHTHFDLINFVIQKKMMMSMARQREVRWKSAAFGLHVKQGRLVHFIILLCLAREYYGRPLPGLFLFQKDPGGGGVRASSRQQFEWPPHKHSTHHCIRACPGGGGESFCPPPPFHILNYLIPLPPHYKLFSSMSPQ